MSIIRPSTVKSLTVKSLIVESLASAPTNDKERFADSGHIAFASVYLSSIKVCPHIPARTFSDEQGSSVCKVPAQLSISVTSFERASSFSLVVFG